ncbi:hypothetical protein MCFN_00875 [Mycoplasmopsis californica]|uniref:DUF2188 domain-containing protein n=1 Tax=Mycoplasmopsis californica TaxID=2113 RepID=A0A059XRC9_9BACT|nr:DUF2188 domain-containing protein [Mycoplasmopsis californica]AIA29333.1 hypothetical protein MCFN_00875 [Mycoplasmopsis californica]
MAEKDLATTYHITPYNGKWQVKGEGNTRPTKLFNTQKEAIEYLKEMKKRREVSVLVHRPSGQVRTGFSSKKKK